MKFNQFFIKAQGRDKYESLGKRVTGRSVATYENQSSDGKDGESSVKYYMIPSCTSVHVSNDGSLTPSFFSVRGWKQVGLDTPVPDDECTIKWGYDITKDPVNEYTYGTEIPIETYHDFIALFMYLDNALVQNITIPIVWDGKDGKDGEDGEDGKPGPQGIAGPVMRGPVEWTATNRRWCNGTENETHPLDSKYIDLCVYNGEYYVCKTSYDGKTSDTWASISSNWQKADGQYDFVATNLLLANNAKIKFVTSTGLYLTNSANQVTGGAQAATTSNDVLFWAGSVQPGDGNFQVDYQGNITAKSGTFAGYVQMPYTFISDLPHNTTGYLANEKAYLIADETSGSYGMGDGGMLILPNPSASLNGFTYHIIVKPNISTKVSGQNPGISIRSANGASNIDVYALPTYVSTCTRASFYGGHVEITCAPKHTASGIGYFWVITQCTGGVDCYTGSTGQYNYSCSYSPVSGYSTQGNYYTITKIKADESIPSSKDYDTFYISRS